MAPQRAASTFIVFSGLQNLTGVFIVFKQCHIYSTVKVGATSSLHYIKGDVWPKMTDGRVNILTPLPRRRSTFTVFSGPPEKQLVRLQFWAA